MIRVIGPKDKPPAGAFVVNTTSRSQDFGRGFSPFILGPVPLWGGHVAQNVENAWQASKIYPQHVGEDGNPTPAWLEWAKGFWADKKAHRYPMGKDAKPLFSWWDGQKYTYTEARKKIYIPLYGPLMVKSEAFRMLKDHMALFEDIYLWDFDGYDHRSLNMSYDDVINCSYRKMGHAFVIAMVLDGHLSF